MGDAGMTASMSPVSLQRGPVSDSCCQVSAANALPASMPRAPEDEATSLATTPSTSHSGGFTCCPQSGACESTTSWIWFFSPVESLRLSHLIHRPLRRFLSAYAAVSNGGKEQKMCSPSSRETLNLSTQIISLEEL